MAFKKTKGRFAKFWVVGSLENATCLIVEQVKQMDDSRVLLNNV